MSAIHKQGGMTLIEVLIAVVILAIGLLGLAGLQNTGLKSNYSAYYRTQASWLAYDMADRMRANRKAAASGSYNFDFGSMDGDCPATSSSVDAAGDKAQWLHQLCTLLGGHGTGAVEVAADAAGILNASISVRWDDSRGGIRKADDDSATDKIQTFTYRTSL